MAPASFIGFTSYEFKRMGPTRAAGSSPLGDPDRLTPIRGARVMEQLGAARSGAPGRSHSFWALTDAP